MGLLSTGALVSGCNGSQSALNPYGAPAIHLEYLIIGIVALSAMIWLLVMVMLVLALRRGRRAETEGRTSEGRLTMTVSAAVAVTVAIIAGMTIASFFTTRSIGVPQSAAVTITVRAQQWWWQVIYAGSDGTPTFQTANEIHIPVGQDVRLQLESADVVHSFWVPSLAGKQDLVPGRSNDLLLRAEKPGIYRGQCAEFCGLQHSHMAVIVVAEAPSDYARWITAQHADAMMPADPDAASGQVAFLAKPCAACHTIRGTHATGTTGPDLTHIGSRQTIAAGLLETTRGSLAAWIADPQTLKPGNNMPMVPLTSIELQNISAYMESLK
ncbi:cytochrome c oxidase subunit II [Mesorhizobium sp. WSM4307]|uniref:cytochrome c oxidase subunit II n=1 Tax=unclassified Mesorhizobium TaxID=325217 RepID=UPI000BAE8D95|nr:MULTISPECIES: cytochrome c oxidase subunit II [unclassified Mesorhizobium]PBB24077.1 cytochrome c oxidase subunit II [Mesorhizobium sp. WSM4304]PBB72763.1 cytochrome c oxidase subunit II [Mesorhizobium sp. WSM4308]TRC77735.1 cytochrome c oxidase subunit II [Mesorhizobium sp. WSM4310]TRC78129.1 cytochrome c oxidase subunit II [Mesorhizobium sp. WSM4315]TRC79318.1 cytochrome c oxidase subunit II [Mesorhizobium sp. WSM4307]